MLYTVDTGPMPNLGGIEPDGLPDPEVTVFVTVQPDPSHVLRPTTSEAKNVDTIQ